VSAAMVLRDVERITVALERRLRMKTTTHSKSPKGGANQAQAFQDNGPRPGLTWGPQ